MFLLKEHVRSFEMRTKQVKVAGDCFFFVYMFIGLFLPCFFLSVLLNFEDISIMIDKTLLRQNMLHSKMSNASNQLANYTC